MECEKIIIHEIQSKKKINAYILCKFQQHLEGWSAREFHGWDTTNGNSSGCMRLVESTDGESIEMKTN